MFLKWKGNIQDIEDIVLSRYNKSFILKKRKKEDNLWNKF